MHPDTDIGPIITKDAQRRIEALIQQGVDDGAQLLLDGRGVRVPGFEEGNFVGPTVLAVDLRGSFDSTARPVVGSMCLQVLLLNCLQCSTVLFPLGLDSFCVADVLHRRRECTRYRTARTWRRSSAPP